MKNDEKSPAMTGKEQMEFPSPVRHSSFVVRHGVVTQHWALVTR
jgi:hypothetical protein